MQRVVNTKTYECVIRVDPSSANTKTGKKDGSDDEELERQVEWMNTNILLDE
jgi:hypothetical protein